MSGILKFSIISFLLIISNFARANSLVANCLDSFLIFNPDAFYVRPGLPIKVSKNAHQNIVTVSVGSACKALGATEVTLQILDTKVRAFELVLAPSSGVIFPTLPPDIQMSISAQLTRSFTLPVTAPLILFKDDRRELIYQVSYRNKIFNETISWGQFSLGGNDAY
jgi:hypothetical protein